MKPDAQQEKVTGPGLPDPVTFSKTGVKQGVLQYIIA